MSLIVWQVEVPGVQIVTLTQGLLGYELAEQSEPFTVMGSTLFTTAGEVLLPDDEPDPPPQPVISARIMKKGSILLDFIDAHSRRNQDRDVSAAP